MSSFVPLPPADRGKKFVGGAEAARRNAQQRKNKKKSGTRIVRPGESAMTDPHFLSPKIPPKERFFASLFKSPATDFVDAYKSRAAMDSLIDLICRRLGVSMPQGGLKPLYSKIAAHLAPRVALIMEESRHALSEALARRWARGQSSARRNAMQLRFESMQTKKSGHLVLVFKRDRPFSPSEQYHIRSGTCYEIVAPGPCAIDRVILGSVAPGRMDNNDDCSVGSGATLSLMIYDQIEPAEADGDWHVAPVTGLVSMVRQFEACTGYAGKAHILYNVMGGKASTHTRYSKMKTISSNNGEDEKKYGDKPITIETSDLFTLPTLNLTQERACKTFLESSPNTVSLVQGPPGSGKTTLLATIICRYLAESLSSGQERRLLVCAPTNKAVSVISSRFLSSLRRDTCYAINAVMVGDQDKLLAEADCDTCQILVYTWVDTLIDELRLFRKGLDGAGGASPETMNRVAWLSRKVLRSLQRPPINDRIVQLTANLDEALELVAKANEHECLAACRSLGQAIMELEQQVASLDSMAVAREVLRSADVVFCTLASAGNALMRHTSPVNDLIVDEAASSTEPELYIPFHLRPTRLLAVGDPMQLPATVFSQAAARMGLSKSLHERLMYDLDKEHIMLDVQYRMKPDISSFPRRRFYENKLANGGNVVGPLYQNPVSVLSGWPYTFMHVNGFEEQDSTGSFYNTAEAHQVCNLVSSLRVASTDCGDWFSIDRVRVITFYQAQVSLIQDLLHRAGLGLVSVATVDSSQGCEADIVVVSFVRSVHHGNTNGRRAAGFLSDDRRLNVALTRAKFQLICVGNAEGLQQLDCAPTLQALARDAYSRDCVVDHAKENNPGRLRARVSSDGNRIERKNKKRRIQK